MYATLVCGWSQDPLTAVHGWPLNRKKKSVGVIHFPLRIMMLMSGWIAWSQRRLKPWRRVFSSSTTRRWSWFCSSFDPLLPLPSPPHPLFSRDPPKRAKRGQPPEPRLRSDSAVLPLVEFPEKRAGKKGKKRSRLKSVPVNSAV